MTRRVVGASILPFCIDPQSMGIYFLLAQERHCLAWPAGSLTWSDFGGSVDAQDDGCAPRCAAREFHEESMAMVPFDDDEVSTPAQIAARGTRTNYNGVARDLMNGCYTIAVNTLVSVGHVYVTYVKQVPWFPVAQPLFARVRELAKQCNTSAGSADAVSPLPLHTICNVSNGGSHVVADSYLEKARIRLFSVPQLRHMLAQVGWRSSTERLRWGFHRRLQVILDQFPRDGNPTCVRGRNGAKIGVDTYQNKFLYNGRKKNQRSQRNQRNHAVQTKDGPDPASR